MVANIVDLRHSQRQLRKAFARMQEGPRKDPPPKKQVPLRERRRRARIILFSILGVLCLVSIVGLHYVLTRPSLRISEVRVTGTELQDPSEIIAYANTFFVSSRWRYVPLNSIFSYPRNEIRVSIERRYPRLESVKVSRDGLFGTVLTIEVTERAAYGVWCVDESALACFIFDKTGYIYIDKKSLGRAAPSSIIFSGGVTSTAPIGTIFLSGKLAQASDIITRMTAVGFPVTHFSLQQEGDFRVRLAAGFYVKGTFEQSVDTFLKNFQLVTVSEELRTRLSELEYMDLRFGNRVYFKFANEGEQEVQ